MRNCVLNQLFFVTIMRMCFETGSNSLFQDGETESTTLPMTSNEKKKADIEHRMRSIKIDCVDVSKVDPEMVLKLKLGIWPKQPHISLGKFMLCVLNRLSLMSKEGVFKMNEVYELIPYNEKDDIVAKIDKCLYQMKQLPYEKAYFYMKCINEDNPQELNIF